MSNLDNLIVELIIKSDDLIDKIINDLSFEKYNLLIDDLNNLSIEQKIINNFLINKINLLKKKYDDKIFFSKKKNYFEINK
jgi:hypothetical protein